MLYVKNLTEYVNETLNDTEWINAGIDTGREQLRAEKDLFDIVMDMLKTGESTEGKIEPGEVLFTSDMYMSGMDAQTMKTLATAKVQDPDVAKKIETGDSIFYVQKYTYKFEDANGEKPEESAPIVICDVVDQGQSYSYVFIKVQDYLKFNDINKQEYGDIDVIPFEPDFESPDRVKFSR